MVTVNSVPGRLTRICYTSPGEWHSCSFGRTDANWGIWVTADFKLADPEWKYSVGLMSRVSQGPSITNSGIHITHPSFRDLQSSHALLEEDGDKFLSKQEATGRAGRQGLSLQIRKLIHHRRKSCFNASLSSTTTRTISPLAQPPVPAVTTVSTTAHPKNTPADLMQPPLLRCSSRYL